MSSEGRGGPRGSAATRTMGDAAASVVPSGPATGAHEGTARLTGDEAPVKADTDDRTELPEMDRAATLAGGAIAPWTRGDRKLVREALAGLARDFDIDLDVPFAKLPRTSQASYERIRKK
mgnify:CR=1 FL=1